MKRGLEEKTDYIHSLDALRGIAAIVVVIFHWRHFFETHPSVTGVDVSTFPFYFWLEPIYQYGFKAVDLFFCISGFIFYKLYAQRIAQGDVGFRQFLVNRLSRLYPLHLATLLTVAIGQFVLWRLTGVELVTQFNDIYHFALQLFFVSAWGFESGESFNTPIWSVSVEMLLYLFFFFICRRGLLKWYHTLALATIGAAVLAFGNVHVGRGLLSFFLGGIVFLAFVRLSAQKRSRWTVRIAGLLLLIICSLQLTIGKSLGLYGLHQSISGGLPLLIGGRDLIGSSCLLLDAYRLEIFLYPAIVLWLALADTEISRVAKPFAFLGIISYSTYLLHFPLQLLVYIATVLIGVDSEFFLKESMFLAFMLTLLVLSGLTYNLYEKPCQKFMRSRRGKRIDTVASPEDLTGAVR